MVKYFQQFWPLLKLNEDGFLALGREDVSNPKQGFSMAVLAIRLADGINGVSWLHGDVSRKMWHNLWPQVPPDDVPIKHVTNGIHIARGCRLTLPSRSIDTLATSGAATQPTRRCGRRLADSDEELWRAHERAANDWSRGPDRHCASN